MGSDGISTTVRKETRNGVKQGKKIGHETIAGTAPQPNQGRDGSWKLTLEAEGRRCLWSVGMMLFTRGRSISAVRYAAPWAASETGAGLCGVSLSPSPEP